MGDEYHITLYDQENLTGTPGYFDVDTAQLPGFWDNRARSMRIERVVTPNCNPTDEGPTVYEGANYTGNCVTFSPGTYGSLGEFDQ